MSQELEKEEKDKLLSYKHYSRLRQKSEDKGQMTALLLLNLEEIKWLVILLIEKK